MARAWRISLYDGDPLVVADANGANERQIIPAHEGDHNHFPVLSTDGRWIYYAHGIQTMAEFDVWRIPSEGGQPEPLTTLHRDVQYPDSDRCAHGALRGDRQRSVRTVAVGARRGSKDHAARERRTGALPVGGGGRQRPAPRRDRVEVHRRSLVGADSRSVRRGAGSHARSDPVGARAVAAVRVGVDAVLHVIERRR